MVLVREPTQRQLSAVTLLAGLLLVFGVSEAWNFGRSCAAVDFYQFWLGAHAIQRYGAQGFYSSETRGRIARDLAPELLARQAPSIRGAAAATMRREIEFAATPLLFASFRLLAGQSLEGSYAAFRTASLILGLAGIVGMACLSCHSWTGAFLATALILGFFEPFSSDLRVANVNLIQLALLAGAIQLASPRARTLLGKGRAAAVLGFVAAAAILFKPNLLVAFALLLLVHAHRRPWRTLALIGLGAGSAATIVLAWTSFLFGSATIWLEWWDAIRHAVPGMIPLKLGNFALARVWIETLGTDPSLVLLAATAACAALALWRASSAGWPDSRLAASAGALGCLCYLIGAPLVWFHYYTLTLPGILLVLRPADDEAPRSRVRLRCTCGAVALILIALRPIADALGSAPTWLGVAAVNLGVALLFATIVLDLAGSGSQQAAACSA
jgi:hypothetical protein